MGQLVLGAPSGPDPSQSSPGPSTWRGMLSADTKYHGGSLSISFWNPMANEYLKRWTNICKQGNVHYNKIPLILIWQAKILNSKNINQMFARMWKSTTNLALWQYPRNLPTYLPYTAAHHTGTRRAPGHVHHITACYNGTWNSLTPHSTAIGR